ncbi:MAG TPA: anti-sigma factor antagonist [Tepidisphaeraceae bacterium]|nr:anti-sigma factor antagonist [Tepidisphaeraceae bacterium]
MAEPTDNTELVHGMRRQGDAVVASLVGEIDLHNSPKVRAALLDALQREKPQRLILNLQGVPYMDSSAIAVLVESLQKIRRTGGKIYLTNLQPRVKGLLEIARLDAIFVLADSEEEALSKQGEGWE